MVSLEIQEDQMINILVLGTTGRTGRLIIDELIKQDSVQILAGLRKESDKARLAHLRKAVRSTVIGIEDEGKLQRVLHDHDIDIVVQAIRLREDIPDDALVQLEQRLRRAFTFSKEFRIVTVGGAGALRLENGQRFWETDCFPAMTLPRGAAHAKLRDYLEESSLKDSWTYLIPPPVYRPDGNRTGSYQRHSPTMAEDFFLKKEISYADFALAVADAVVKEWRGTYLISI